MSAGIGLFILPRTWTLLSEDVGVLLEGTPANVDLAHVRHLLHTLDGVADVHDLHAWALTSERNTLSVHLVRADHASHDDVLVRAQRLLTDDVSVMLAIVLVVLLLWMTFELWIPHLLPR